MHTKIQRSLHDRIDTYIRRYQMLCRDIVYSQMCVTTCYMTGVVWFTAAKAFEGMCDLLLGESTSRYHTAHLSESTSRYHSARQFGAWTKCTLHAMSARVLATFYLRFGNPRVSVAVFFNLAKQALNVSEYDINLVVGERRLSADDLECKVFLLRDVLDVIANDGDVTIFVVRLNGRKRKKAT